MKIEHTNKYQEHGVNLSGNLIIVEYWNDAKQDRRYGDFNSQVSLDYLGRARAMVKEQCGDTVELLSIPVLVCRVVTEAEKMAALGVPTLPGLE